VNEQPNAHLAFTTKGKTLYAIALEKPAGPFIIEATLRWKEGAVKSVRLIGSGSAVKWELTPQGLQITPPENLGESMYAWSFEIVTDREQHTPDAIQEDASKAARGTKKVDLEGQPR
jgi:alpha-L-fucosidase